MEKSVLKTLKKGDWLVLGLLTLIFIASLAWRLFQPQGNTAAVYVGNTLYARLPLNQDRDLLIQGQLGESALRIRDGQVWIQSAPCPHKICMQVGKIRLAGETIVCIPNRILIRVLGDKRHLDGITM